VRVKLYIEGGGDRKNDLQRRFREGFRKLFENAGFTNRMPIIIAGGGREHTFNSFKNAFAAASEDVLPVLLVDSEDPITTTQAPKRSSIEWEHLKQRDGWTRPYGATADQAQLMVTCMETWIMADRGALAAFFGSELRERALLPVEKLEERPRERVQQSLSQATRDCKNAYQKGTRSFQLLAQLDPEILKQHLRYFHRLIETLNRYC